MSGQSSKKLKITPIITRVVKSNSTPSATPVTSSHATTTPSATPLTSSHANSTPVSCSTQAPRRALFVSKTPDGIEQSTSVNQSIEAALSNPMLKSYIHASAEQDQQPVFLPHIMLRERQRRRNIAKIRRTLEELDNRIKRDHKLAIKAVNLIDTSSIERKKEEDFVFDVKFLDMMPEECLEKRVKLALKVYFKSILCSICLSLIHISKFYFQCTRSKMSLVFQTVITTHLGCY
jgi:hypothetical protein